MGTEFRIDPKWSRTKEQIWQDNFAGLQSAPVERVTFRPYILYRNIALYAAAVIAILLIPFVYEKGTTANLGEHTTLTLPDGSTVHLNADSRVSYKPLLWFAGRDVELTGEAFFEVEKGKSFTVQCDAGSVEVLGTKFNVYSRDEKFDVKCTSGSVKVALKGAESQAVIIGAGESVIEEVGKKLRKADIDEGLYHPMWMERKFSYNSAPLSDVLKEIERQYNISIKNNAPQNLLYSGSFTSDTKIDELLEIVTLPFSLIVEKEGERVFIVK